MILLRPDQVAAFCGRCGHRVATRDIACPHCSQTFAEVARCHSCHASGILPLDRSIWGRYRLGKIDRPGALSKGFVCLECGYQWRPNVDSETAEAG